ncbi:MAG: hypothetical protein JNN00_14060 [Chitinophagaceae bacterium]|nr:hypothetical protein [Chitinophagaceae bacterium]
MKILPAISFIAFAFVLSGFIITTDPVHIDGKLVVHAHDKRKCRFEIVVKGDDKILASAPADSTGRFSVTFIPADEISFDFFYIDSHHAQDTIYLKSYKEFESDRIELTFYTFKGYLQVDEDDHVICPKCGQPDKVSPIEGLPGYYYCAGDKIKF